MKKRKLPRWSHSHGGAIGIPSTLLAEKPLRMQGAARPDDSASSPQPADSSPRCSTTSLPRHKGNLDLSPTNIAVGAQCFGAPEETSTKCALEKEFVPPPPAACRRRTTGFPRREAPCAGEGGFAEQARYQTARFAYVAEADVDLLLSKTMVQHVCNLAGANCACVMRNSPAPSVQAGSLDDMEIRRAETRLRRSLLHRQNSVSNVDALLSLSSECGERSPESLLPAPLLWSLPISPIPDDVDIYRRAGANNDGKRG